MTIQSPIEPERTEAAGQHDILIVDDDPPIRNLLRQVFVRIGFSAREARDGQEAVEIIESAVPRLMMLDLMMPRMNGWQVLEHLRENGLLERIPVVVLTAVGAHRTEGLSEFGVRAILSKPFEIQDLIRTVNEILEKRPTPSS
ncbi:MAG TPA: response regulator [Thermoanaerobaculia bacterium]